MSSEADIQTETEGGEQVDEFEEPQDGPHHDDAPAEPDHPNPEQEIPAEDLKAAEASLARSLITLGFVAFDGQGTDNTSSGVMVSEQLLEIQRLTYLAFGWPMRRSNQIGAKYGHLSVAGEVQLPPAFQRWYESDFNGEKSALGRALRAYVQDLRTHLAEAARVLAPGGLVAYSVANSVRAERVFDLAAGFEQLLAEVGFSEIRAIPRAQAGRRILPPGRDPKSGRFSSNVRSAGVREYIVLGRLP
ncbi:hypothetical protein E1292_28380 [Nonomuraea deserti]|uniref:Uncharacterized protein n=1 Tax=Nonomuraea deserti TaxID=1848322 RepID=A0A4R4VET0_9ACTN|nr:hypothetical protein [Nonomuraea deserti]TDD00574.1 hypothetical protein E1292_28380 [Nonomuraea deserti]